MLLRRWGGKTLLGSPRVTSISPPPASKGPGTPTKPVPRGQQESEEPVGEWVGRVFSFPSPSRQISGKCQRPARPGMSGLKGLFHYRLPQTFSLALRPLPARTKAHKLECRFPATGHCPCLLLGPPLGFSLRQEREPERRAALSPGDPEERQIPLHSWSTVTCGRPPPAH